MSAVLAPDSETCPRWCCHEHLGEETDRCGFHHDGPTVTVSLDDDVVPGRELDLFVNVSQLVQPDRMPAPPLVEVQDAHRTLALLTPLECVQLSQALLEGAAACMRAAEKAHERAGAMVADLQRVLETSHALMCDVGRDTDGPVSATPCVTFDKRVSRKGTS